jgi:tetratricopeptide (TPR) repeat protein/spermidine synthase
MFGVFLAAWQCALDAVAGRTVYSLAAFGLAVGGGLLAGCALAWRPCRRVRSSAALLSGVLVLAACWLVFQLAALSGITGGWQRLLLDTGRTFGLLLQTLGKTAAFFLLVPSVLAGAAVTVVVQAAQRASVRRPVAQCVGWGAVMAVSGYLAGHLLVPVLGVETLTRLAALWFGALASLAALGGETRRLGLRLALACAPFAGVAGLLAAFSPVGGPSILSDGAFGRLVHRDSGFAQGRPLFEHRTRRHSVAAYADPDYQFVFALDGRPLLFGNRFHTARTLTGYVPLLVRPSCAKAVLVGPEAGVYLPFFMRAGVTNVAVSGADRTVVNLAVAADAFVTGDETCEKAALRTEAALSDAAAGYDVIFLVPEPVWMRGARASTSRAQFVRCSRALSAEGIVALHLDARALSAGRFAAIAHDFKAVFPGVQIWCTGSYDWVLVGAAKEIKAPVDGMLALFEREPVFRDFVRAGGVALPEALACMLCDGKGLDPWLKETVPERAVAALWHAPRTALEGVRTTLLPGTLEGCRQWKSRWVLPGEMDADLYVALLDKVGRTLGARVAAVKALAETAKGRNEAGLESARAAAKISTRDALLVHLAESVELEGRRRIKIGDLKGALKCYENLLSFSAGTARTHHGMGYCLRGNGDNENAYLHFGRAVAAAPEQTDFRLDFAQAALAIGEYAEADRQFSELLKREPDHVEALFRYAKGLSKRERPVKDLPQAVKLAERACELTQWENQEYAFGLADLYMDAGRVLEGMGLKRRLKEGVKPTAKVSR